MDWIWKSILLVLIGMILLRIAGRKIHLANECSHDSHYYLDRNNDRAANCES